MSDGDEREIEQLKAIPSFFASFMTNLTNRIKSAKVLPVICIFELTGLLQHIRPGQGQQNQSDKGWNQEQYQLTEKISNLPF